MTTELKSEIVQAAHMYSATNKLTLSALATKADINISYLSRMMEGVFEIEGKNNKVTVIANKWFSLLAAAVGYSLKKEIIEVIATPQFTEIIAHLEAAKNPEGKHSLVSIIAPTGSGKTYTKERFMLVHPKHTYELTVSSLTTLPDIINGLCESMKIDLVGNASGRLKKIAAKVKRLKLMGEQPLIIIDEAENLNVPALKMMKALYDAVKGYGVIVQIGTGQLLQKVEGMSKRNKEGMPQYYRRMKAGVRTISAIDTNFNKFLDKYVSDKDLKRLLRDLCDNYGELTDYLEPALLEANKQGVTLTEDLFRLIYNMPKY